MELRVRSPDQGLDGPGYADEGGRDIDAYRVPAGGMRGSLHDEIPLATPDVQEALERSWE